MFYHVSATYKTTLSLISNVTGPVSAGPPAHRMGGSHDGPLMALSHVLRPSIVATHVYSDAPALDVLLVPGGIGTRVMGTVNGGVTWVEEFINERYEALDYLLSVCTGSLLLARSGVLDGKKATTNKGAWEEVVGEVGSDKIEWVPTARWVVDGKIWSSSGVSAGKINRCVASSEIFFFCSSLVGTR